MSSALVGRKEVGGVIGIYHSISGKCCDASLCETLSKGILLLLLRPGWGGPRCLESLLAVRSSAKGHHYACRTLGMT